MSASNQVNQILIFADGNVKEQFFATQFSRQIDKWIDKDLFRPVDVFPINFSRNHIHFHFHYPLCDNFTLSFIKHTSSIPNRTILQINSCCWLLILPNVWTPNELFGTEPYKNSAGLWLNSAKSHTWYCIGQDSKFSYKSNILFRRAISWQSITVMIDLWNYEWTIKLFVSCYFIH